MDNLVLTSSIHPVHTHLHTHTHTSTHTHLYTHTHLHTHTHTYTHTHLHTHTPTHTSSCVLEICLMMTHTPIPTFDCVAQHIFVFHVYRSVSLARMRSYTHLPYLYHQCATSLLSRDSRIADCTVRHPGVERPFSSIA